MVFVFMMMNVFFHMNRDFLDIDVMNRVVFNRHVNDVLFAENRLSLESHHWEIVFLCLDSLANLLFTMPRGWCSLC